MRLIKRLWNEFRSSPVDALYRWQEQRFLWIAMAVAMGGLVIVAHSFFQVYLHMMPCEQCVYIRFAMIVMTIGGIVAAINPKNVYLKLFGVIAAFYGAIKGLQYSLKLNEIHHAVHGAALDDMFGVQGCSTDPSFPFGLPLNQWSPHLFQPTGDCGYDAPVVPAGVELSGIQQWFIDMYQAADGWYLIPSLKFLNMAQSCALAFGLCLAILVVMLIAWAAKLLKSY